MGRLQGVRVSTVFPAAVIQDVAAHMWTRVTDKALLDGSLRMPARECVDVAPLWDGDRPVARDHGQIRRLSVALALQICS